MGHRRAESPVARRILAVALAAVALAAGSAIAAKETWRDPSQDPWIEIRTENFRVFSNAE